MVDWMHHVDAQRMELRELNDLNFSRFDARLTAAVAELRPEMRVGFAELRQETSRVRADLMKWMLVFWVGAVGAIAALAGVLR